MKMPHRIRDSRTLQNKIRRILRSSERGAAELYAAHTGMVEYLKALPAYKRERKAK